MPNNVLKMALLAVFIVSFLYPAQSAMAVAASPGMPPHHFSGNVDINGGPAPDGIFIIAKASDTRVVVGATLTFGGRYGNSPFFLIGDPDGILGDGRTLIGFFIRDLNGKEVRAGEAIFNNGGVTELDLSGILAAFCGDAACTSGESCSSCSRDCGTCPNNPPGGGGSGGSGAGASGNQSKGSFTAPPGPCKEDWVCSEWLECFNSKQKRICVDRNSCGSTLDKPLESQKCISTTLSSVCGDKKCDKDESCSSCEKDCGKCRAQGWTFDGITGLLAGNQAAVGILIAVLGIVVIVFALRKKLK